MIQSFVAIESGAPQELGSSRTRASELLGDVKLQAAQTIRVAAESTEREMNEVRRLASDQVAHAKREVPARLAEIRADASQTLQTARARIEDERGFILGRARRLSCWSAKEDSDQDNDRNGNTEEQQEQRTHGKLLGGVARNYRSRWRPPKVAAKLATKAPTSRDTNSHSAP